MRDPVVVRKLKFDGSVRYEWDGELIESEMGGPSYFTIRRGTGSAIRKRRRARNQGSACTTSASIRR